LVIAVIVHADAVICRIHFTTEAQRHRVKRKSKEKPIRFSLCLCASVALAARFHRIPVTIVGVKAHWRQHLLRYATCLAATEAAALIYRRFVHVNPTTVALTYLLMVLWVAAYWGFRFSVFLAVLATLAFNYYFLPPIGTFTVADPQNWVALFAFLITAGIASQLADRARRQAADANQRRRDVERLYAFSQRLLATDNVAELLNAIPAYIRDGFGAKDAAVYLLSSQQVYRTDPKATLFPVHDLQMVSSRGEPVIDPQRGISLTPLHLGTRTTGAVGIAGPALTRATLEALGSMIGIAIERAGAMEKLSQTEAAHQSENLRSVLLDSVTHELRTPLTGIKAAVTGLLSDYNLDDSQRKELLTVINEETDRLDRLVGEATEMAQLDAHKVELHMAPVDMASVIECALEEAKGVIGQHPLDVRVPATLPKVRADADRIGEALKQLLENAAKYSPPDSPIAITAESKVDRVVTSVTDHGPGIDDFELSLVFDKFYRGRDQRYSVQGTGMGLAIARAIVEAHNGTVGVTSQLGRGSVFSFEPL
jgi:two-component system sensor histidine kinase KdpD